MFLGVYSIERTNTATLISFAVEDEDDFNINDVLFTKIQKHYILIFSSSNINFLYDTLTHNFTNNKKAQY